VKCATGFGGKILLKMSRCSSRSENFYSERYFKAGKVLHIILPREAQSSRESVLLQFLRYNNLCSSRKRPFLRLDVCSDATWIITSLCCACKRSGFSSATCCEISELLCPSGL